MDIGLKEMMEARYSAYFRGFDIGFAAEGLPDYLAEKVEMIACHALGFVDGLEYRRMKWPKVVKPEFMNEAQVGALLTLYLRGNNILPTFPEFMLKAQDYGDYVGTAWSGMFIGIEKDGYAHS